MVWEQEQVFRPMLKVLMVVEEGQLLGEADREAMVYHRNRRYPPRLMEHLQVVALLALLYLHRNRFRRNRRQNLIVLRRLIQLCRLSIERDTWQTHG